MLWGIIGAFIGVPILIALATVCTRHPAACPIRDPTFGGWRDADENRRMTDNTLAVDG
jgi:hypothetical protein